MSDGHHAKQPQQQPPPTVTYHPSPRHPWFKTEDESSHPHVPVPLQPHGHDQAYSFAPAPPQPHCYRPPHYSPSPPQHPHPHGPLHYSQQPPQPHEEQDVPPPPQQLYPHGSPNPLQQPLQPPRPYEEQDAPPPPRQSHVYSHTDKCGTPPTTIIAHRKKTRAPRASVACESCRELKAKCDEEKPCRNCWEKNIECTYRETASKVPSDMEEILRGTKRLKEEMEELKQELHAEVNKFQGTALGVVRQMQQMRYAAIDGVPRQTVPPGDPTVLDYYGTSAGRLLLWPTIFERVQPLLAAEGIHFPPEYPTLHEQQRGGIRWHGRFEGVRFSPFTQVDIVKDTPLQPNGDLDLHPGTAWEYVKSYEENIQNMYPLIPPNELHAMVTMVLQTTSKASTTQVGRAQSQAASLERPPKRKRESEVDSGDDALAAPSEPRLGHPSCSIESALVLMVLALGQICLHKRVCATAVCSTSATETRDINENIGREYFAAAFHIFGALRGAYKLEHVWVYILGSLCYDQLGRPIQSLELVTDAGRYLQDIIQPDLQRYGKIRADVEQQYKSRDAATRVADNRILVAAWTCLLLERDILVELNLKPSNMLSFEQQLPYPDGDEWVAQGFDYHVCEAFASQAHLYTIVNEIYRSLQDDRRQDHAKYPIIKACIEVLQSHESPNPAFQNSPLYNRDLPATDILAARLHAVYWRAEVTVHRSFIQRILAFNYEKRVRKKMAGRAFQGDIERLDELAEEAEAVTVLTVELAQRGIRALVRSTRAFHGLPDQRFVISNVFGTAHAQWGNLLMLDSVQRDPVLGRLIDNDTVNDLFVETIAFLERVAEPSSSLSCDLHILRGLSKSRFTSVSQEQ